MIMLICILILVYLSDFQEGFYDAGKNYLLRMCNGKNILWSPRVLPEILGHLTVVPAKGDSDVMFCLQL